MKIIGIGLNRTHEEQFFAKSLQTELKTQHGIKSCARISMLDAVQVYAHHMFKWAGLENRIYYQNNPRQIHNALGAIPKTPNEIWQSVENAGCDLSQRTWIEHALKDADYEVLILTDVTLDQSILLFNLYKGSMIRVSEPGGIWSCSDDSLIEFNNLAELSGKAKLAAKLILNNEKRWRL